MWTVTIISKQNLGDKIRIAVIFNNDSKKLEKDFYLESNRFDLDYFKSLLRSQINELDKMDAILLNIPDGAFDYKESVSAPPTNQDVQKIEYKSKFMDLKRKLEYVNLGIFTEDELQITQLREDIKKLAINTGDI